MGKLEGQYGRIWVGGSRLLMVMVMAQIGRCGAR